MEETRIAKLLKAATLIKARDDKQVEIDKLVALSMQTGYEMGKLAAG